MQIIKDIPQGGDEWHALRLGVVTASKFKDVLAKGKGLTRKSYMHQLAAETLTGEKQESHTNEYMEWGTQTEPQARAMYELVSGYEVEEVSFVKHSTINTGCSPDGLIGMSGMVEFKCPKTTTQIETYLRGKMPSSHVAQVQGQMWVSERDWCDFVSFDPRINGDSGFFHVSIKRDDAYIKELEWAVFMFCNELAEMIDKLKQPITGGS